MLGGDFVIDSRHGEDRLHYEATGFGAGPALHPPAPPVMAGWLHYNEGGGRAIGKAGPGGAWVRRWVVVRQGQVDVLASPDDVAAATAGFSDAILFSLPLKECRIERLALGPSPGTDGELQQDNSSDGGMQFAFRIVVATGFKLFGQQKEVSSIFAAESAAARNQWGAALMSCRENKLDSTRALPSARGTTELNLSDTAPPSEQAPPAQGAATAGVASWAGGLADKAKLAASAASSAVSAVSNKGLLSTLDDLISDVDGEEDANARWQTHGGSVVLGAGPVMVPPGCEAPSPPPGLTVTDGFKLAMAGARDAFKPGPIDDYIRETLEPPPPPPPPVQDAQIPPSAADDALSLAPPAAPKHPVRSIASDSPLAVEAAPGPIQDVEEEESIPPPPPVGLEEPSDAVPPPPPTIAEQVPEPAPIDDMQGLPSQLTDHGRQLPSSQSDAGTATEETATRESPPPSPPSPPDSAAQCGEVDMIGHRPTVQILKCVDGGEEEAGDESRIGHEETGWLGEGQRSFGAVTRDSGMAATPGAAQAQRTTGTDLPDKVQDKLFASDQRDPSTGISLSVTTDPLFTPPCESAHGFDPAKSAAEDDHVPPASPAFLPLPPEKAEDVPPPPTEPGQHRPPPPPSTPAITEISERDESVPPPPPPLEGASDAVFASIPDGQGGQESMPPPPPPPPLAVATADARNVISVSIEDGEPPARLPALTEAMGASQGTTGGMNSQTAVSSEARETPVVVKSGWAMVKHLEVDIAWTRRWLVLRHGQLEVYDDQACSNLLYQDSLQECRIEKTQVRESTLQPGCDFDFAIRLVVGPTGRSRLLVPEPDSEAQRSAWGAAFMSCRQRKLQVAAVPNLAKVGGGIQRAVMIAGSAIRDGMLHSVNGMVLDPQEASQLGGGALTGAAPSDQQYLEPPPIAAASSAPRKQEVEPLKQPPTPPLEEDSVPPPPPPIVAGEEAGQTSWEAFPESDEPPPPPPPPPPETIETPPTPLMNPWAAAVASQY